MGEGGGTDPGAETVADVGEFGLIDRLRRGRDGASSDVEVGPGDDAAVLACPDGRPVISTDIVMQDRHFRLDWSTPFDIGVKAIAQNGADIAAMGARCLGFVVGLGLPPSLPVRTVEELYDGMWAEADRAGAPIVGGDVVSAPVLMVSVTVFGTLDGRQPVRRSGARVGDVVAINSETGWSAAGLAQLSAGIRQSSAIDRHRRPQPDYGSAVTAAAAGAGAMIDTSDGLLADLGHIAHASAVSIDLASASLRPSADLIAAAATVGGDPDAWVLGGGEDHALVATFPSGVEPPTAWRAIGRVVGASSADAPAAVTVDGQAPTGDTGWTSFRVTTSAPTPNRYVDTTERGEHDGG